MTKRKTGNLIVEGKDFGSPKEQAKQSEYDPKLDAPKPRIASLRKKANIIGPTGFASTSTRAAAMAPLYYDPRRSTPDKFWFPRSRIEANSVWREFYRRDAVIAIATDMYTDLPWSDFDLVGIDDNEVKHIYEDMFSDLNLVPKLPDLCRDFIITGELALHCIFNSTKGYWERVISHNVDYIDVLGLGLAIDEPLLYLRPTPEHRQLVTSTDPNVKQLCKALPRKLYNAIKSNRKIPLDSLNTTYIARLVRSQDVRGTSMYTRLYRINMYEDFVINSSLAVAQRNAVPIRLLKIGDPNPGGWLPSDADFDEMAEKFSIAESDPLALVMTHPHVTVEYVGVAEKGLSISREWEFIQNVKLLALGVSKSFLTAESSFASSVVGLQTLLERLASLRMKFEKIWMLKKLCEPVAQMHDFYKRPKSELDHRIRVKDSDKNQLLIPTIKWKKSLEPLQDASILNVWRDLKERGILSDRTYSAGSGIDVDVERRNQEEERKFLQELQKNTGTPGGLPLPEQEPKEFEPKPPQISPTPMPVPGASKIKKTGNELPYGMEHDILEMSDSEGKVDVDDLLENLRDYAKKNEDKLDTIANLIKTDKNLLTGF